MIKFKFDIDKALSAILYVSRTLIQSKHKDADYYRVLKMLYFADKKHIAKYGRPILGDDYIAMEHGPVPSKTYDIVKIVTGSSVCKDLEGYRNFFTVNNYNIIPQANADMDDFSETDIECLDESIAENWTLSFGQLKTKSHDSAYKKAFRDDLIQFREIAKAAGATNEMIHYMQEKSYAEALV